MVNRLSEKRKTINIPESLYNRLEKHFEPRENWADVITRIIDIYEATAGAIPADDETMRFFGDEHRRLGNASAATTLTQLFTELRNLRAKEAKV